MTCQALGDVASPPTATDALTTPAAIEGDFHLFSCLPAEIRLQIWRLSMPYQHAPALIMYRKTYWDSGVTEDPDPEIPDEMQLEFQMYTTKFVPVRISAPTFFVSQEARSVTMRWMHAHGLQMRRGWPHQSFSSADRVEPFVRPYREGQDALFIPNTDIVSDRVERMWVPNLMNRILAGCYFSDNVAIPEDLVTDDFVSPDFAFAPDSADGYMDPKKIFVIVDVPKRLYDYPAEAQSDELWEIEDMQGQASSVEWNSKSREFEVKRRKEDVGGLILLDKLLLITKPWVPELVRWNKPTLIIQPARLIKK